MEKLDELFVLKNHDDAIVQNMLRHMSDSEFRAWLKVGADFKDTEIYSKEALVKVLEFIYGLEEFSDKEMILLDLLAEAE
jgi:uncharacterized protein related to proFAR isomerase